MASIIKSPKFSACAKQLTTSSCADRGAVETNAKTNTRLATDSNEEKIQVDDKATLVALQQRNRELEAEIEQIQATVRELEQSNVQQDVEQVYASGHAAGVAAARDELQTQIHGLTAIADNLHEQGRNYLRQLEQSNVESIFATVGKIIGQAAKNPAAVKKMVRTQLLRLASQQKVIVHVAPQDYQLMLETDEASELKLHSEQWQFVADDHIQHGGCIIEADGGGLDARLDIQMQQFKDLLLDVYARRQAGDR